MVGYVFVMAVGAENSPTFAWLGVAVSANVMLNLNVRVFATKLAILVHNVFRCSVLCHVFNFYIFGYIFGGLPEVVVYDTLALHVSVVLTPIIFWSDYIPHLTVHSHLVHRILYRLGLGRLT